MGSIEDTANRLKAFLIENLVSNVKEQNQNDTLVEYALLFHMERIITLDERILLLKKLHVLCGTNYVHRVPEERDGWDKFEISLCHLRKISCIEEEIMKEFKNLWPIINRVWPQYISLEDNDVQFLHHLISNHAINHPNDIELIKILFSVAPSTSPLECSYGKLSEISTMEVLYILSAINNPKQ